MKCIPVCRHAGRLIIIIAIAIIIIVIIIITAYTAAFPQSGSSSAGVRVISASDIGQAASTGEISYSFRVNLCGLRNSLFHHCPSPAPHLHAFDFFRLLARKIPTPVSVHYQGKNFSRQSVMPKKNFLLQ